MRFVIAPTGNEARYRVNEVLAGFDLPNDAVGVTGKASGGISVDDKGVIIPADSRIVVDVTVLKSDKDRRDGYVQRRLLETEKFPTVELTPTAIRGLPVPLPGAQGTIGPQQLQMTGQTYDLKVTLAAGRYFFQCDPHALLGMVGHLEVK